MNDDEPPKCPVCRSVFVRPRMYECGHSICEACMVGIDEYTERYFSELPNYKCPCCRKETVVPWHRRPINQALESICQAYPEYEARQQDAVPNDYETPKNIQATDLATMASTERRRIAKEQYQALLPTLYEAAKMEVRPSSFPVERRSTSSLASSTSSASTSSTTTRSTGYSSPRTNDD